MCRSGGKQTHLVSVNGHHNQRQALWEAMRELKEFSTVDLEDKTRVKEESIRCYLTGLTRAGYLEHITGKQRERTAKTYATGRWKLIKDTGIDAPRVNKRGEETTLGCVREQLWRTMRILGQFGTRDLAVHAGTEECAVSLKSAKEYLRHLRKAGYVINNGNGIWRLVKNTGPKPPIIQDIPQVFDQNLGEVVWRGGAA